ncbi:hypothetical protein BJF79_48575 [Actinomadura sp. CNU-125]|nr:hypothetical protein BJF79_48575 [Actinomadura sp. CNU-125]
MLAVTTAGGAVPGSGAAPMTHWRAVQSMPLNFERALSRTSGSPPSASMLTKVAPPPRSQSFSPLV